MKAKVLLVLMIMFPSETIGTRGRWWGARGVNQMRDKARGKVRSQAETIVDQVADI